MKPVIEPIYPPNVRKGGTYSPAVRVGGFLYVSGMTSVDENREIVGKNDMAAQARFIYQKISKVLAAAGVGFDKIVETTDYVTTLEGYSETADVRREVFGDGPYPASTGVQVVGLVRPDALIEIRVVAYLGETSK
ncbi:MAG: RidA family protein [Pigmentiphaga sp.]